VNIGDNFISFSDAYNSHSTDELQKQLTDSNNRIKFEEWLIGNFSDSSLITNFQWHSKVISWLSIKATQEPSPTNKRNEDLLIANLITKADPTPKNKDLKEIIYNKVARFVNQARGKLLNYEEIYFESNCLQSTSTVLFSRMIKHTKTYDLIHKSILKNDLSTIKMIIEKKPEEFKQALLTKDQNGDTLISLATLKKRTEIINLMAETAPEEFQASLIMKNNHGNTPVGIAAFAINIEILLLIDKVAPQEFKTALSMKNNYGDTPLLIITYAQDLDILELMIEICPEATNTLNCFGKSMLDWIKMERPPDYKRITESFKNSELHKLNQELVKRVGLGHIWDEDGHTSIIEAKTEKEIKKIPLSGHSSPEWFHIFSKDLELFKQIYPHFEDLEIPLLKEMFDISSNLKCTTSEEKLERIKKGLPLFVKAGFKGHEVTVLIWGDMFVICNRGGETRCPLEIYHFAPETLTLNDLNEILKISKKGTSEDYKKLFFETLTNKLLFTQTNLDAQLEEMAASLPNQTAGNCSMVSPITGIFAFRLLLAVNKIQKGPLFIQELIHLQTASTASSVTKANTSTEPLKSEYQPVECLTDKEEFFSCESTSEEDDVEFFSFESSSEEDEIDKSTLTKNPVECLADKEEFFSCESSSEEEEIEFFSFEDSSEEEEIDKPTLAKIKEEEGLWYQTWLSFEKMNFLERSIKPLENNKPDFKPDHRLIANVLNKAHNSKLDEIGKNKLKVLTEIFVKSLNKKEIVETQC
jgi:hypothetical protein